MHESYREKLAEKIVVRFSDMELRIMEDIIRRIKKTGEITSTADYQIGRLMMLGNSTEDIEKFIKDALDASYPEMFELYDHVLEQEYVRNRALYEQVNVQYIPYEENYQLQQIVGALKNQTAGDFENITRSMGFMVDMGGGRRVFTPMSVYYQQYLDEAMTDIAFGAFDYNTVLRRTVAQMANSGIRTVYYAPENSGRIHANRIDVAVRRAVMTGTAKLAGEISQYNAKQLDTEYFEVSWHEGARPAHREWHGQVWSRQELESVCGLGEVTGLCGANCRHSYYPFVPGASERQYTDEWLEAQAKEEDTPKYFRGKGYTMYEATQKQRRMETAMRAQREKVHLLKQGGADDNTVMLARCKYQAQLNEYAVFSKKMGLVQQRERIYLDMRGRAAPSQSTYKKWQAEVAEKTAERMAEKERRAERAMRIKAEMARRADMDKAIKSDIIKMNNKELPNGLPIKGIPASVVDKVDEKGKVLQRRIYDEQGRAKIDYDTSDHGLPSAHPTGAHKHIFNYNRKNPHGKPQGLTEDELEQNKDIIKRGVNYHEKG